MEAEATAGAGGQPADTSEATPGRPVVTPLWTYITRCRVCGQECKRAEHVPEAQRAMVAMGAPMFALCNVAAHNTLSDLNYAYEGEWQAESPAAESPAAES